MREGKFIPFINLSLRISNIISHIHIYSSWKEELSNLKLFVLFQLKMSKTKHLNRSLKINIIERYIFLNKVPQRSRYKRSI